MTYETDLLDRMILRCEPIVRAGAAVPHAGEADHDTAMVATALLVQGWQQARAARTLLGSANPENAIPNIRSLYECFGELTFLLSAPNPADEASTAYGFAIREMLEVVKKGDDAKAIEYLQAHLNQLAIDSPQAAENLKVRKQYWTPLGRKALVDEAVKTWAKSPTGPHPGLGAHLYKLFSWDAHHVMACLTRVDPVEESPTFGQVRATHPWADFATVGALLAGLALESMHRQYRERFPADS